MFPPRVLVTRASHQGSELAERLRSRGFEPVLLPTIEIAGLSSYGVLDAALSVLDHFDWLLFTSANAVEVFRERRPLASGKKMPKIGVIGAATARALRGLGLSADLVPAQAIAEALAAALLPHARQPEGRATRFLLVRAEEGREHLPETLRRAGAEVTVVPAYRTVVPSGAAGQLHALFAEPGQRPAAVVFTSSSTARNLLALSEAAGLALPDEMLRLSIGPITSQTLRELGFPPHAESPAATLEALVDTASRVLRDRGSRSREEFAPSTRKL